MSELDDDELIGLVRKVETGLEPSIALSVFESWPGRRLEARAAFYSLLEDEDRELVEPPPSDAQLYNFLLDFYVDAVVNEDPSVDELDYTPNPVVAATICQAWCLQWPDVGFEVAILGFEKRLRERFLNSSRSPAITSSVRHLLRYLLVDVRIRAAFERWNEDHELRPHFQEAIRRPLVYAEVIDSDDVPRPRRE